MTTDTGLATFQAVEPKHALLTLRGTIEHAIVTDPRSLQKRIGPSAVGEPCTHCLAANLAGWEQTSDGDRWLTAVGRAVHEWLEMVVLQHELPALQAGHPARYITEGRVTVGQINGMNVTGSCDLFDLAAGLVVDWKITSTRRMPKGGRPPSPVYRAQAHLYGRGWVAAGHRVEHVAICFLPRDAVSLDSAVWWTEPYDEQIALGALERATALARNLEALTALGPDVVAAWIAALPREPGCFSCLRYPDVPEGMTKPGHHAPQGQFQDLLP